MKAIPENFKNKATAEYVKPLNRVAICRTEAIELLAPKYSAETHLLLCAPWNESNDGDGSTVAYTMCMKHFGGSLSCV